MKIILVLAFDLKGKNWKLRKKINRLLHEMGAKLIYTSHWILPYGKMNVVSMKQICNEIRKYGGKAEVIKGEKVG